MEQKDAYKTIKCCYFPTEKKKIAELNFPY